MEEEIENDGLDLTDENESDENESDETESDINQDDIKESEQEEEEPPAKTVEAKDGKIAVADQEIEVADLLKNFE